jgi:hypothetical protein
MTNRLDNKQLIQLIRTVFNPSPDDHTIGLITDIPNTRRPDNNSWTERRVIVQTWFRQLNAVRKELHFDMVTLAVYENVESNNADLPEKFFIIPVLDADIHADKLAKYGTPVNRNSFLSTTDIIIAPTEYSATAPLKMLARELGFRAATMPGFSGAMIPSLGLDYGLIHERVMLLKRRLDDSIGAHIKFFTGGIQHEVYFDLRHRPAHASSGLIHDRGTAGNLPSGETYIVPYEGELEEDQTRTEGTLPITFGGEVVLCKIKENRVYDVTGGEQAHRFIAELEEEPARGNIAELGFGVLDGFGIQPAGRILLDEKLGLHVAFGRSDHFGGITGPQNFHNPKNVIHQDYVYVPSLQPDIEVSSAILVFPDDRHEEIMRNGRYVI